MFFNSLFKEFIKIWILKLYVGKKRYVGYDGYLNIISCKWIGILSLNLVIIDYNFSGV